jgi:hypothetical protein
MILITSMLVAVAIGGGEQPTVKLSGNDRLVTAPRPLASTSGRALASVGTDRALASTGTDRALISTGTDRALVSTGKDRALASTGRSRGLTSSGRDRALVPTGGLPEPGAAPSGDGEAGVTASVSPMGGTGAPVEGSLSGSAVKVDTLAVSAPAGVRSSARFSVMLGEAKDAMSARDFHRAEQILYTVRTAEPAAWDARLRYATNLVTLGHYDRSLTELTAALKGKTRDDELPAVADLFGSTEVFTETQGRLKQYRSVNSADPQALLLDALLESMAGNHAQAATLIGEARTNQPGWAPIEVVEGTTTAMAKARTEPAATKEKTTP